MNKTSTILLFGILVVLSLAYIKSGDSKLGATANRGTIACTVQSTQRVIIGNQASRTILAAHSNRAWARIQTPANATSTHYLAMATGTAAVVGDGIVLNGLSGAVASSTVNFLDFGLNTDFPYTGEVTGITNTGSTTVLVTECRY